MNLVEYLNIINEKVEILERRFNSNYDKKLLIAFRGESKDFGRTKLMPSIFRNEDSVKKESYLFDLFCDLGLININDKIIDKATETQHYAAVSRMLDITFDCLVALYFASISDNNSDGYVYVFGFPSFYSPHSKYIEDLYKDVLNSNQSIAFSGNFRVFSQSYFNERIRAQKGGFVFFPSNDFSPIDTAYYDFVIVSADDKKNIISSLDKLFHLNTACLFPEKENIAEYAKKKFFEDYYDEKNFDIKEEIAIRIEGLEYEITMNNRRSIIDKKRYIRKIKTELENYINQNIFDYDKKEKMNNDLTNNIKMLSVKLGGKVDE